MAEISDFHFKICCEVAVGQYRTLLFAFLCRGAVKRIVLQVPFEHLDLWLAYVELMGNPIEIRS